MKTFPGFVTPRAVVLGLVGVAVIAGFQLVTKARPDQVMLPFGSATTLFTGVVFYLFVLAIGNGILKRLRPEWALRPAEMAVVYGLATVGAAIAAQDEVQYLLPVYAYPFREAQEYRAAPFRPFIPKWMIPQDPAVIEPYYIGRETFWQPYLLRAWAIPLFSWIVWLMAVGLTMWAWNVILRRRWVEHDRLAFPCVQLPLEMCRSAGFGGLAAGRLFWGGFLVAALLISINRIGALIPSIPTIATDLLATPILEAMPSPWKALAPMYLTWDPLHLGICYLIPTDILFSSWFFYLLRKACEVWGYAMGWRELGWDASGFPYTRAQAAGSWAVLFFLLVWAERKHLGKVLSAAFGGRDTLNDAEEFGSYRWAGRFLIFGTLFLIWWSVQSGMSWGLSVLFYAFFWIQTVTMTRIYAQVGPPILELYYLDPQKTLTTLFGTMGQSTESLTQFSLMYWINRDHRGQPMAHQLSAFYVGQRVGVRPRALGRWVLVAFFVGVVACLLVYLHWAYRLGEDQWTQGGWRESGAGTAISRVQEWVYQRKGPQYTEITFMGIGALLTLVLAKLNTTFIGTPFHPIGYALAVCFAVEYNWPAFLMVWIIKSLMLRYGGRALYLKLVPFAFGLTLGGFVVPVFWGFAGWLFEWYQ